MGNAGGICNLAFCGAFLSENTKGCYIGALRTSRTGVQRRHEGLLRDGTQSWQFLVLLCWRLYWWNHSEIAFHLTETSLRSFVPFGMKESLLDV